MSSRFLITGATGFVGGYLAEALVERGWEVSAIVRPHSDTALLEQLGVTLVRGDLSEPQTVTKAVSEVDTVIHCAAKVGDWGPVAGYRQVNVEALRTLLDVCKGQALSRFIHLSSLGV